MLPNNQVPMEGTEGLQRRLAEWAGDEVYWRPCIAKNTWWTSTGWMPVSQLYLMGAGAEQCMDTFTWDAENVPLDVLLSWIKSTFDVTYVPHL